MNTETPRVFIAATRQNDGKTTVSLGLIAALQEHFPRVGYIKPVGQRFVEIEEQKIDEDTVLMDAVYRMNCPLVDMSPIAVEPDFTRKYLQASNNEALVKRIQKAFDRVAWEKDFVLCEGSGHAGVGSVFDLSNARVAKLLGAKVIIVSQGGIGKPIDEIALNQALFEKESVEVIGVMLNKVLPDKVDHVADFAQRGLKRKGLELLGVLPYEQILGNPSVDLIREELHAELLNTLDHAALVRGAADQRVDRRTRDRRRFQEQPRRAKIIAELERPAQKLIRRDAVGARPRVQSIRREVVGAEPAMPGPPPHRCLVERSREALRRHRREHADIAGPGDR